MLRMQERVSHPLLRCLSLSFDTYRISLFGKPGEIANIHRKGDGTIESLDVKYLSSGETASALDPSLIKPYQRTLLRESKVGNVEEKKTEEKQDTEKSPEKQEKKTEEKQDTEKSSEKLETTVEQDTEKCFENLDTTTKQEEKTEEKQYISSEKQEREATQEPAKKEDNAGITRHALIRYTITHGTFGMKILASDGISATALARQILQSPITFTQSVTSVVTDDFNTARGGDSHLSDSVFRKKTAKEEVATKSEVNEPNEVMPVTGSKAAGKKEAAQKNAKGAEKKVKRFVATVMVEDGVGKSSAVDCDDDDIADHEKKYISPSNDSGLTSFVFDGTTATETTMHVDPAEKAYDAAKGFWAWGKGVFVMKHFLGIAEGLAGKVVGMAGSTLEDLDHAIMPRLQKWDDSILNPALQAMVGTILGAVKKSEDIFKPVVFAILKPIGLIKEDDKKSSEPELTTKPTMI
jgi:hypothetical protein